MKPDLRTFIVIAALVIFAGMPILLYALGDFPRRSLLKEAISAVTLLAFSLMLGQFFLARSNMEVIKLFNLRHVQLLHKIVAYSVVSILLLHPLLIVLPRFFEAGVDPWDALVTMLTTFESAGIVLGLIAWVLLLVLVLTAIWRMQLIRRFHVDYRNWRYFHGLLSVALTAVAIVHAIELGRHTDSPMAVFMIVLAIAGSAMLFRMYLTSPPKPAAPLKPAGAK